MATAHLVIQLDGEKATLCRKTVYVHEPEDMQPGIYGTVCSDCQKKIKESWVTFK